MPAERDYYEILGIAPSASDDDIKRAYRKLAGQLHPDRNPDDREAEESFKKATAAYAVLGDSERRKRYDRLGHAAFTGQAGSAGGVDPVDFEAFSEVIGGIFGDMFRGKRGRRARDLSYELTVRFEEAALGCDKSIEIDRAVPCAGCGGSGAEAAHPPIVCDACRGKGEVRYQRGLLPAVRPCGACRGTGKHITHPCQTCSGSGQAKRRERLRVSVPAGVEDGNVRSVRGAGEHGPNGRGDLHVTVRVEPHELFSRKGADILCTVPVSFPQAVLGDQLDIPTLEGLVKMRLPPGTESGKVFRLRGKGMPVFGGVGKGDQLVSVVLEVPKEVTKRQKDLLEALALEMGDTGFPERKRFRDKLRALFDR